MAQLKSTTRYIQAGKLIFALLGWCLSFSCKDKHAEIKNVYNYILPQYGLEELNVTKDSVTFQLDETTYNDIKSFNAFTENGVEYISFYDRRSQSINIYDLKSRIKVRKIFLSRLFNNGKLYKPSVYVKNFDSIFINNTFKVYLYDSSGVKKRSIPFLEDPRYAWAVFDNSTPPFFKNDKLYASVRPFVNQTSLKAMKAWKVLYEFDLKNDKATLHYHLPELYQRHLYGHNFLDYSHCINSQGNFIFSFPADTLIYQTDLAGYNRSYYGKSRYQQSDITPISKDLLENKQGSKEYMLRDSYGPIYYDPIKKYYLRLVNRKISEADYNAKNRKRKQSVIIFNQNFKIIGESDIAGDFSFDSIFFTSDGQMYVRSNTKDENALHFVRLEYKNSQLEIADL